MALNFPNTPTNAQSYVDPNGHTWVYETATNSWTAQGAPVAGMVYKGSIDITTAPPTGAATGSVFTVSTGGTPNAGFIGLPTTVAVGTQVIFDGTKWQLMATISPDATEATKGLVELATAAETTTGTDATRAVHPAGLKVELDKKANLASPTFTGTPAAPTAAVGTNTTQVATTAFVHAADKWTRTGTTLSPSTAGDTIQGQLVPTNGALGSRNVIINGMVNINQRGVTIAAAAVGAYGPDRWKKVDAGNMTQIVEDVNFVPGAKYTLSWKGGTPQVLTAPATGHWTLPNIPITATEVQLALGEVATPFERRSSGQELALCQRYTYAAIADGAVNSYMPIGIGRWYSGTDAQIAIQYPVEMRAAPTLASNTAVGTFYVNTVGSLGGVVLTGIGLGEAGVNVSAVNVSYSTGGQTTGQATTLYCNNTSLAKLVFSAEL